MLKQRIKQLLKEVEKTNEVGKLVIAFEDEKGFEVNGKRYNTLKEIKDDHKEDKIIAFDEAFKNRI
jgi:hypothetical protein